MRVCGRTRGFVGGDTSHKLRVLSSAIKLVRNPSHYKIDMYTIEMVSECLSGLNVWVWGHQERQEIPCTFRNEVGPGNVGLDFHLAKIDDRKCASVPKHLRFVAILH